MKRLTSVAALRGLFVLSAAVALVTTTLLDTPAGHTIDGTTGPATVSVTPNEWLSDGQTIAVHAETPGDVELFEVRARVCQADAGINNTYEFSFDGPFCANAPVSAVSDFDKGTRPDDRHTGNLEFRVGAGTATWTTHSPVDPPEGQVRTLTCGPGAHCDLVVQLQITNDTVFSSAPLLIGEGTTPTPPAPADQGAAPPAAAAAGSGDAGASSGAAGAAAAAAGSAKAKHSGGAAGADGGAKSSQGDASNDSSVALNSTPALATSPRDAVTRGVRVFSGGIAGLVGGALIVVIVMRARRRINLVGAQ